jgi:exodeoxyribonuclease VII small subunit
MKELITNEEIEKMDFETAFKALQENVEKLEGEELQLEASLMLYKQGQALAKHCAALLEDAELQLRSLANEPPSSLENNE